MKYLLLLLVLVVAYVWWSSQRRASQAQKSAPKLRPAPVPPPAPQEMVTCAVCQVHLPRTDALAQGLRYYCCTEHQHRHAP